MSSTNSAGSGSGSGSRSRSRSRSRPGPASGSSSGSSSGSPSSSIYDDDLDGVSSVSLEAASAFADGLLEFPAVKGVLVPPAAAKAGGHPILYSFAQAFGEKGVDGILVSPVLEADMISSIRFAQEDDMIATGDKGGRIVILKRTRDRGDGELVGVVYEGDDEEEAIEERRREEERRGIMSSDSVGSPNYGFWTQFQSHEPEFDYLKSMEIEEKINQIRWCRRINGDSRLIATNDKTIKVWRISEKDVTEVASLASPALRGGRGSATLNNSGLFSRTGSDGRGREGRGFGLKSASGLALPTLQKRGRFVQATPRRIFSNSHAYHINSISLNSDEETFLSSDDLRVNMWNLNVGGDGFNVLDMKPDNMEELTEVITAAEFHPQHCHLFMHSSSRGITKLCDLRQSALCQTYSKEYDSQSSETQSSSSYFSEIIASISDIVFSPDGRYLLTRDYMNLRLWDLNMERAPVLSIPVHDHLTPRLCDLYDNDCIFDKFQCAFSHDGGSLLTGSYISSFQAYSAADGNGSAVEATVDYIAGLSGRDRRENFEPASFDAIPGNEIQDPSRRILQLHASPSSSIAAVAAGPALFVYWAGLGDSDNRI